MKIGILTFHRALNYGAVLQCYALQKVLKHLGHEVEIIDYRPWYIERYRKPISWRFVKHKRGWLLRLKIIVAGILYGKITKRAVTAFDGFIDRNLCISDRICAGRSELLGKYDVVVVGSDQIWNHRITFGFDFFYCGKFEKKSKLITYAASLGEVSEFSKKDILEMKAFVPRFDALSVREDYASQWLTNQFGAKVQTVLDPTLLLDRREYDTLAIKPAMEKYVFVFVLDAAASDGAFAVARAIAEQCSCKIATLHAIGKNGCKDGVIQMGCATPGEYLGLIKHAECIVAVSFHAVAFSVIFGKDFYSIKNGSEGRVCHFLSAIHLQERHVNPAVPIRFSPVNYTGIDGLLEQYRKSSMEYLKNQCK